MAGKAKMGRPTTYTPEMADLICRRLTEGDTLLDMCGEADMPGRVTVYQWLVAHRDFANNYAHARRQQAHALWDEAIKTAREADDKDSALCARVRVDALTKLAGKLNREVYGEKLDIESRSDVLVHDASVDRPPRESREDWINRRAKELGIDPRLLGTPAGAAD